MLFICTNRNKVPDNLQLVPAESFILNILIIPVVRACNYTENIFSLRIIHGFMMRCNWPCLKRAEENSISIELKNGLRHLKEHSKFSKFTKIDSYRFKRKGTVHF